VTPHLAPQRPWLLGALVAAAVLRVAVFAAVFPFFHQVDEHQHVDAVVRWSRGELPGPEMSTLGPEVVDWSLRFGVFDYLQPGANAPPYLARRGSSEDSSDVRRARAGFEAVRNQEFDSPPVYYATAGLWYRLGEALGLEDLDLLVWLRLLNALVLGGLVWGSHVWLRARAPDDPRLHWGVPALIAFVPQDAFYGVTSDAFCAGVGALAFAAAVEATRPTARRWAADLGFGLAVAAAFLAKYTNVVFVGAAGLAYAVRARFADEPPARLAARVSLWSLGAGLPVAAWLARNHAVMGDWLATGRKVALLEWRPLPWSQLLEHPVFRPWGLAEWLPATLAHLWRGELRWQGEPMTWPWLDAVYAAGTALALAAATVAAWRALRRRAWLEPLAWAVVMASLACLAVLSARFEYADWGNPTRAHPYFVEARLILGALLPFAVLFVRGVATLCDALLPRATHATAWVLAAWIALATVSDFALAAPVFASPWSWLHAG
jgi:hypothetical protein